MNKQEKEEIKRIREIERHKQNKLTALYKEKARGRKKRKRADWDFWGSLRYDLKTPKRRKGIRKNIDKMIFG